MKESRKELIKRLHSIVSMQPRYDIEKEFPKLFKSESLEVGKWYKYNKGGFNWLMCFQSNKEDVNYGFNTSGTWGNSYSIRATEWTPATDKEVEEALIKEAKKRGFKEGVNYIAVGEEAGVTSNLGSGKFRYGVGDKDALCICGYLRIYYKGKWATIINTITKAEAEKELGKTII